MNSTTRVVSETKIKSKGLKMTLGDFNKHLAAKEKHVQAGRSRHSNSNSNSNRRDYREDSRGPPSGGGLTARLNARGRGGNDRSQARERDANRDKLRSRLNAASVVGKKPGAKMLVTNEENFPVLHEYHSELPVKSCWNSGIDTIRKAVDLPAPAFVKWVPDPDPRHLEYGDYSDEEYDDHRDQNRDGHRNNQPKQENMSAKHPPSYNTDSDDDDWGALN
jgi:hypothetical protein